MEKKRIRPVYNGNSLRISYSRQEEVLEIPDLIEASVDKKPSQTFLPFGFKVSRITDPSLATISAIDFVEYMSTMKV